MRVADSDSFGACRLVIREGEKPVNSKSKNLYEEITIHDNDGLFFDSSR